MKANHVPVTDRLLNRISSLEALEDSVWIKGRRGNPYNRCKYCNVHTPEFSNRGDRHFGGCQYQGLRAEIYHYRRLLAKARGEYLWYNSGKTLGVVGVHAGHVDGRYTYLPCRTRDYTWIRTRDLYLTSWEAEAATAPAKFLTLSPPAEHSEVESRTGVEE